MQTYMKQTKLPSLCELIQISTSDIKMSVSGRNQIYKPKQPPPTMHCTEPPLIVVYIMTQFRNDRQ